MISHSKMPGFTLVELLIVMLIISLGVSLVGGFSIDSYSKFQVTAEQKQLSQAIRKLKRDAFSMEQKITLRFSDNNLMIEMPGISTSQVQFVYLDFPEQRLQISKLGLIEPKQLKYQVASKSKSLTFQ